MNNIYPYFTSLAADGSRIVTGRSCITKDDKVYILDEGSFEDSIPTEVMPETLMCEMKCAEVGGNYDLP